MIRITIDLETEGDVTPALEALKAQEAKLAITWASQISYSFSEEVLGETGAKMTVKAIAFHSPDTESFNKYIWNTGMSYFKDEFPDKIFVAP